MPELCRFYGIRITIYFDDHLPSHFHAEYGTLLNGKLPSTAKKLVNKWYKLQKKNIEKAWDCIQNDKVFEKIPPLE